MSDALLVELQTEELPPKALRVLGDAFATGVADGLKKAGLVEDAAGFDTFATPRRLAVRVSNVQARAADREVVDKLMPKAIALDAEGRPTDALRKRLDKAGRGALLAATDYTDGVERLYFEGEGRAAAAWLKTVARGRTLADALQGIVEDALARLPIPKRMTYQRYTDAGVETTVQFVRPAHRLVALHGADVVDIAVLGLRAGRVTAGHRFLSSGEIPIAAADDYADALRERGFVIASFDERAELIRAALAMRAGAHRVIAPDALVDEVTALVEWPVVYEGGFDGAFLDVPQECLILTMQQNQKYFAMTDADGRMVNRFLVVSNLATDDPSAIVGGNERVLRARLADAKFFFDQDRKRSLASRVDGLKTVVYHNRLGSQYERMERVEALAGRIASLLGHDVDDARRAARLAKADLATDMVGEFPELQGLMGRYYATHDGEKPAVAEAIEAQYRPRFAGDALPSNATGIDLALADKLESLAGLFGIGALPTGDKDPFALRRHALGVVRMLVEKRLPIDLVQLVEAAIDVLPEGMRGSWVPIVEFVLERARSYFLDRGFAAGAIESVLGPMGAVLPLHVIDSIVPEAIRFIASDEGRRLAEANKRITNILRKSEGAHEIPVGTSPHALARKPDAALFVDDAERALWSALREVGEASLALRAEHRFAESLDALSALADPTAVFFERVMVNADDPAVRDNRLALLQHARAYMNQVAELSTMAA